MLLRPYGKFLVKLTDTRVEFFATANEKGMNVVEYANMINEMSGKNIFFEKIC